MEKIGNEARERSRELVKRRFCSSLRRLLKETGTTIPDLSRVLGIGRRNTMPYSWVDQRMATPSIMYALPIAAHFRVSLESMIGRPGGSVPNWNPEVYVEFISDGGRKYFAHWFAHYLNDWLMAKETRTVKQFADSIHVHRIEAYRWQSGGTLPKLDTLSRAAKVLGIEIRDFFVY